MTATPAADSTSASAANAIPGQGADPARGTRPPDRLRLPGRVARVVAARRAAATPGRRQVAGRPFGGDRAPVRANLTHIPLRPGPLPPIEFDHDLIPGEIVTRGGVTLYVRQVDGPAGSVDDTIAAARAGEAAGSADPAVSDDGIAVYVHGLGGSSTNWTDLARLLAIRVPGIVVDLPGFGRSEPPRGYAYTLEAHADTVGAFLRGLGAGPVHLVGNSMGGAISLMIAARHPDLVRTLTLVSPAVPDLRLSADRMSDPRLPLAYLPVVGARARRALAAVSPHDRALQMIRLCFAHPEDVPPERIAAAEQEFEERLAMPWAREALGRSTVGLVRSWLAPKPRSLWTMAADVQAPTLVVWGAQDKLVSVRKAPRTARLIPRGRLLVLPRTGHVAQMERPQTVARAMLGMFEEVARGRW